MLCVVQLLIMVTDVELFVLVYQNFLLEQVGIWVLFYHCTHYTLRGSDTVRGIYCGTFCNRLNDTYGDRYWHFGAALK